MKINLKVLTVDESIKSERWNNYLLTPLKPLEKVISMSDQEGVDEKYVRVIHGNPKTKSVFHKLHFQEHILLAKLQRKKEKILSR